MKTAICLGATGLTGGILLKLLLEDKSYTKIKIFSRRSAGFSDPKIEEYVIDLFELERYEDRFTGDEVFCSVGSTQAKTPDSDIYHKVDYGIPVAAAKLAKKKGIEKFMVVSALGADVHSRFFYNKMKGEMEREILDQDITFTYIFQPSLIAGYRKEKRPFEWLWKQMMKVGNYFLHGKLKVYRSIKPEVIAAAMLRVAGEGHDQVRIKSDEIKRIAER